MKMMRVIWMGEPPLADMLEDELVSADLLVEELRRLRRVANPRTEKPLIAAAEEALWRRTVEMKPRAVMPARQRLRRVA